MRWARLVVGPALLLGASLVASAASIKVLDLPADNHAPKNYLAGGGMMHYYLVGKGIEVAWSSNGLPLQSKARVELLRNGSPVRTLVSGLPIATTQSQPMNGKPELLGFWPWKGGPGTGDVGCGYAFRVVAEPGGVSGESAAFSIFDELVFKDATGNSSPVRVDAPNSGVLTRGKTVNVKWSLVAHPPASPPTKLKLELYYQNAKVGDIVEVPIAWSACPVRGQFPWVVGRLAAVTNPAIAPDGKNVVPGNSYQIRISSGDSGYLGGTFFIALTGGPPAPGGTPIHRVTPGPGSIKY